MKIHHFAIQVKDLDKSIEFYTQKLGFKVKTPKTLTQDGKYSFANLALHDGEAEIELVQTLNEDFNKSHTPTIFPHIALESADFDKDLQMLKKRGLQIFGPHIIPNDVKFMTILDPDNYQIDIGQLLKKKSS